MTPRGHILVVDDNPDIVDLLTDVLALEGYHVHAAVGDLVLPLARAVCPDLILLDAHMPGLDGAAVCGPTPLPPRFPVSPSPPTLIYAHGPPRWAPSPPSASPSSSPPCCAVSPAGPNQGPPVPRLCRTPPPSERRGQSHARRGGSSVTAPRARLVASCPRTAGR